jgi:hypothetical protein
MATKAEWSDWIFCGVGSDTKDDVIKQAVDDYFQDAGLFCVSTKKASGEIIKQNILGRIKDLEQNDILICDANFKKAIWFNSIGVMKYGVVPMPLSQML